MIDKKGPNRKISNKLKPKGKRDKNCVNAAKLTALNNSKH